MIGIQDRLLLAIRWRQSYGIRYSIEQTGALLSACVEAGINNIDRVSYLSSQYDACYQEALSKAIEAARKKAEVMAQASGCTLGSVVHIEEYLGSQEARYNSYSAARKR